MILCLLMKKNSRRWMTKRRTGKKTELESQAAGIRGLQFPLLLGVKAQRQLIGYPQRGLITQRSKSLKEKKGGWEYFLDTSYFPLLGSELFFSFANPLLRSMYVLTLFRFNRWDM